MTLAKFARICGRNAGGNSALYLAAVSAITAVTVTTGEISAVTMVTGPPAGKFLELQSDVETIVRTEEGEGIGSLMKYLHRVAAKFSSPSKNLAALRDAIATASPCGLLAIVTDSNGKSWLVGYNATDGFKRPLRLRQDNLTSGAEIAEEGASLADIALETTSGYISLPFDDTLGAAILGGSATFIDYVT